MATDEIWNPGVPDTIDLTPTWETAARIYSVVLEDGTEEGKRQARAGLLEMGRMIDEIIRAVPDRSCIAQIMREVQTAKGAN